MSLYADNKFNIILPEIYKEDIEIRYTNTIIQYFYLILMALIIDYKEQVFITDIIAMI